jgi:HAMP domain-containing protein
VVRQLAAVRISKAVADLLGQPGRYVPLFWRLVVPSLCLSVFTALLLALGRTGPAAGMLGLLVLTTIIVARRVLGPLERLADAAEQSEAGRARVVPVEPPASEASRLAQAVNLLVARQRRAEDEVARLAEHYQPW